MGKDGRGWIIWDKRALYFCLLLFSRCSCEVVVIAVFKWCTEECTSLLRSAGSVQHTGCTRPRLPVFLVIIQVIMPNLSKILKVLQKIRNWQGEYISICKFYLIYIHFQHYTNKIHVTKRLISQQVNIDIIFKTYNYFKK